MLKTEQVRAAFPGIDAIADARLRALSYDVWRHVSERNHSWSDVARLPLHPTMPIAKHGNLVKHVVAMVRLSEAIVPLFAELWNERIDLDLFRAACYVHDAAKVIEFTETKDGLAAIPGYNHAIEAGRIVRELGGAQRAAAGRSGAARAHVRGAFILRSARHAAHSRGAALPTPRPDVSRRVP